MTSSSSPSIPNLQDYLHHQNSLVNPSSSPTIAITAADPNPSKICFKPKFPRHKPTNSPSSSITRSVPPCTECGKRFLSWKALFGHMRCHPERQWRGINPPPNHRPPSLTKPSGPHHFTVEEYEVANILIMLANGPRRVSRKFEEEHKCGVCFKGFSSGQALGGHMRCHMEGGGSSVPSPRDFVLDLNLPPPLEGDGLDLRVGLL